MNPRTRSPRLALLALVAVLCAPPAASAQRPPPAPTRPMITTVVGHSLGFDQTGVVRVVSADRETLLGPAKGHNEGGWLAGIRVQRPLADLLAVEAPAGVDLVAGFFAGRMGAGGVSVELFPERPDTATAQPDTGLIAVGAQRGVALVGARLGLAFQVPVQLPTSVTVAPAVLRIVPQGERRDWLDREGTVYHPALNLGASVDLPTRVPGLSIHLSGDDYLTFPTYELRGRVERSLREGLHPVTSTRIARKASHLLVVQLGLSATF